MTKKKKTLYGLVMGLGLLALLVDRLMVDRPESASAAVVAATAQSNQNPAIQELHSEASEIESVAVAPFPQISIEDLPTRPLRDAFTITPAAVQAMGGTDSTKDADSNGPSWLGAAQLVAQHELSAVLETDGFGLAVIDGQWIRVGDTLGACKLIEITGRQAVFECHDGAATLEVASSIDESYAH